MTADSPRRIGRMPNSTKRYRRRRAASGVEFSPDALSGGEWGRRPSNQRPSRSRSWCTLQPAHHQPNGLLRALGGHGWLRRPHSPQRPASAPARRSVERGTPAPSWSSHRRRCCRDHRDFSDFHGPSLRLARRKTEVRHDMPGAMEALARLGTLFKGRLWVVSQMRATYPGRPNNGAYAATARGPVTPDASAFLARWFIAETCGVPHPKGIHSKGMTASPKP